MSHDWPPKEPEAIRFQAQVFKVQTLIDGGVRLTLDLCAPVTPETIVALFDSKQPGIVLAVAALAINNTDDKPKHTKPRY
jgi:hypothetical protein